jgi:hypothetical protein
MPVLWWAEVARAMPVAQWQAISADGAPPGVYTPNMSDEDARRWKARAFGGDDPRVEIRKRLVGVQLVVVVRPGGSVRLAMNGTARFTQGEFRELADAYAEALAYLSQPEGRQG